MDQVLGHITRRWTRKRSVCRCRIVTVDVVVVGGDFVVALEKRQSGRLVRGPCLYRWISRSAGRIGLLRFGRSLGTTVTIYIGSEGGDENFRLEQPVAKHRTCRSGIFGAESRRKVLGVCPYQAGFDHIAFVRVLLRLLQKVLVNDQTAWILLTRTGLVASERAGRVPGRVSLVQLA